MAIDSRAKRQSAAWVGAPLSVSILPAGTINAPARQQISYTYRGIAVTPPPPVGTAKGELMMVGLGF